METAASERENANEEASGNAAVDMRNPQEGTRNPMEGGLTLAEIGIRDSSAVQDTVFGKMRKPKTFAVKDRVFLVLAGITLLALLVITIQRLVTFDSGTADFTFGFILLLNTFFFLHYVVSGVFFERPYELGILVVCTLVIWLYLVLNYAVSEQGIYKMIRLIIASVFSPFIMIIAVAMIRSYLITNNLIFRTVGANAVMQDRAKTLFMYIALLKADLQVSLSMSLCVLNKGSNLDLADKILLPLAIVVSILSFVIAYLSVRREDVRIVIVYIVLWFLMPAFCIYLIVASAIYIQSGNKTDEETGLTAVIFVATILCLIIRAAIIYFIVRTYLNFGAGLKERVFGKYVDHSDNTGAVTDSKGIVNPAM